MADAAADLADAVGFENVTVSALARRFGVADASLYSHIKNVQDLRTRVAVLAVGRLVDTSRNARALVMAGVVLVAAGTIPFGHFVPGATTANAIARQIGAAAGTACIAVLLQRFVEKSNAVAGFHSAFWATLVFVALGFVPALFLPAGGAGRTVPRRSLGGLPRS